MMARQADSMNQSKTTILLISHYHGLHGAEQALLTLCSGLEGDFEFIVVTPGEGILNEKLSQMGVKNLVVSLNRWIEYEANLTPGHPNFSEETVTVLVHLIEEYNVNIVQTNTSIMIEGALAARRAGVPHIWHLHEFLEHHPSLTCPLPLYFTYRFMEAFSQRIVVVSQALAKSVNRYISTDKVIVIPNGLYVNKLDRNIRQELEISKNSIIVTNVGAIIEEKGCKTLVDAAVKVCEMHPEVVVLIVGPIADKTLDAKLKEQVAGRFLQDRVHFLGYRTDVPAILEASDIYLCSSLMETFSMAIVEAMSFAKPVVSTKCGGPEEIVDNEETGLLVPIADVEEMVLAVKRLVESPEERKRFGNNGKKKYYDKYTPVAYWSAFKEMYLDLGPARVMCDETEQLKDAFIELLAPGITPHLPRLVSPRTSQRNLHEEKVAELMNSLSWRITAPLRAVYDFLMRLKP